MVNVPLNIEVTIKPDDSLIQGMIEQIVDRLESNGVVNMVRDGDMAIIETEAVKMIIDGDAMVTQAKEPEDSLSWFRKAMNG